MIMHSKLRRRHTWPFELLDFLCEDNGEVIAEGENVNPNQDQHQHHEETGNHQGDSSNIGTNSGGGLGDNRNSNIARSTVNGDGINNNRDVSRDPYYHQDQHHHHQLEHLLQFEEVELNDTSHTDTDTIDSHHHLLRHSSSSCKGKNGPDVCTCKSSNNKIGLLDATTVLCASILSNSENIVANNNANGSGSNFSDKSVHKTLALTGTLGGTGTLCGGGGSNQKTFTTGSSSSTPLLSSVPPDLNPKNEKKTENSSINDLQRKGPGSREFQPIQDKFSFLSKKSRDSRKRKQKEKAVLTAAIASSSSTAASVGTSGNYPIRHKDFCPHSKLQEVKSISPNRKSDSSSISSGVFRSNKHNINTTSTDRDNCFTSTSSNSNNNSPSHSQHSSGYHNNSSQGGGVSGVSLPSISSGQIASGILRHHLNNKSSSIGSGGTNSNSGGSGSGLKGSVVTANIINCNSHHETEGKIPSANGTATGALSLQVNTANGEVKKTITLWQNYYPEGQWGWIVVFCALIVQAINHGVQLGFSAFLVSIDRKFHVGEPALLGFLGSTSTAISLFFSPVWVSFCKTKSTRLSGVFGGLVASLGCLFTSFASQFHQLFFSYGAFIGVGVGLSRDASTLMVGQYFKRKREMVEIIVVAGSGLGISFMSVSIHTAITSIGWRLGLQAVTGAILLTFFLGTCYRSASLYHPQRRAILHLKNQKKKVKVKDISKREEKPPFLDYSCLKSKTLQILLLSSAFTAFGINGPLFYLSLECGEAKVDEASFVLLHIYVGAAWVVGCFLFGLVAVQKNQECRVSKQYLCQVASVICGIAIIALTAVKGYSGLVVFSWVYGFALGGYNYALKVYTYERVRARHFARAWSFVQSSQAIPIFVSTPLIGYMNVHFGRRSGYYMSAVAIFIGSACLFLTDVRRRRLSRRKAHNSSMKTTSTSEATQSPKIRRLSFAFPVEPMSPHNLSKHESGDGPGSAMDPALMSKELTCISEEGLAEIDFQDIYFDDWAEYLGGDCITSCNKVENCLASEYDPDFSLLLDRRTRRWSRNSIPFSGMGVGNLSSHGHLLPNTAETNFGENLRPPPVCREIPVFRNHPWGSRPPTTQNQRSITVIDEASV